MAMDNEVKNKAQESETLQQIRDLEAQLEMEKTKNTKAFVAQSKFDRDMNQMKLQVMSHTEFSQSLLAKWRSLTPLSVHDTRHKRTKK